MKNLAGLDKRKGLLRQRGEMPIGTILIIALVVIPLVLLLIIYGGKISESFKKAADEVVAADGEAEGGYDPGGLKAP